MLHARRGLWFTAICAIGFWLTASLEHAAAQDSPALLRLPPVNAVAGNPQRVCHLTLADVRQRALASNKAIALARLNIDGKEHATSAASKDYLPKVLGSVTYFHFDNPLGTVLSTRGTALPATVPVNVLNQNTSLSTAMVAQPITKLIAVNAAVQVSRADEEISRAQLDQGMKQVLSGVTQAYYALIGTQRIRTALQLQATMLEQAVAMNPAPQLRISLLEVRQGIVQADSQIQDLTDQLNDLLDFPAGTMLELSDPVPAAPPFDSAEQAAAMSMSNNPEIRQASQTIVKAEAALKIAKMSYLPDVNVVGGYANQTGASYIQQNFTYVGVTGNYTFWEWGKRVDVCRQRESDLATAHQNLQVVSDKVRLEARKAFTAFQQALASYRLADEMVKACQEVEKTAADPAAKMTARAATANAELEGMKAEVAYRVAHAQLASLSGCQ